MSKKFEKLLDKLNKNCGSLYNAVGDNAIKCINTSSDIEDSFSKMLDKCGGDLDKLSTYLVDLGVNHYIETKNQFEFFCFDYGIMIRFNTETGDIRCLSFLDILMDTEILDTTFYELLFGSEDLSDAHVH